MHHRSVELCECACLVWGDDNVCKQGRLASQLQKSIELGRCACLQKRIIPSFYKWRGYKTSAPSDALTQISCTGTHLSGASSLSCWIIRTKRTSNPVSRSCINYYVMNYAVRESINQPASCRSVTQVSDLEVCLSVPWDSRLEVFQTFILHRVLQAAEMFQFDLGPSGSIEGPEVGKLPVQTIDVMFIRRGTTKLDRITNARILKIMLPRMDWIARVEEVETSMRTWSKSKSKGNV